MDILNTYCGAIGRMKPEDLNVHKVYHDLHYGFPIDDDNELFCRLILEINQAGLSWTTILNKKENFFKAYDNFEIKKVAKYNEKKIEKFKYVVLLPLINNHELRQKKLFSWSGWPGFKPAHLERLQYYYDVY